MISILNTFQDIVYENPNKYILMAFRDVKMEEGYTSSPPPYYRLNSRASKNRSPDEKDKLVHTPIQEFKVNFHTDFVLAYITIL